MNPIALATVTSAVTLLATEAAKAVATQAAKDAWERVKAHLGFDAEPSAPEVPALTATALQERPELLPELQRIVAESGSQAAGQLVGTVNAEKVVVAQNIDTLHM
ncbi:MAG: hypothetical protein EOO70_10315 [Myxococcaceae bacterium]|nr:MAG: hypothetical protein EOO70_10315 [Myxococcaceae bacterium]